MLRPVFGPALVLLTLAGPSGLPARAGHRRRPGVNAGVDGGGRGIAAKTFLATLTEADRAKVLFRFDDAAQKPGGPTSPAGIFKRAGFRLGDLTAAQREAALKVMATALSRDGYRKITEIMNGDEVLKTAGGVAGGPAGWCGTWWTRRTGGPGAGPGAPGGPRGGSGADRARAGRRWRSGGRVLPRIPRHAVGPRRGCCSSAGITWPSTSRWRARQRA